MSEITLGRYLFERLKQLDVNTVFGLPGDFNLSLLDKIYDVEGMRWAGNANELNAAYAADGYSRIKRLGCLITTFGVGELSALNGVGGAYAEHVGLIHVVGVPSISSQAKQLLLHHTLGNGDFTVFHRMSNNISHTSAFISDINSAPGELDRCIRDAYVYQRPVYIGLPANLVDLTVPASLLDTPIDLSLKPNDPEAEQEVIDHVLNLVSQAKNPVILVDACCSRHDCKQEARRLVEITQFPVYTTPMGKGTIDEGGISGELVDNDPNLIKKMSAKLNGEHSVASRFGGVYVGTLSTPQVKEAVESADLILSLGALLSDFNTGSFSYSYRTKNVIEFHSDYTKIRQATFPGVQMKECLNHLLRRIAEACTNYVPQPVPKTKLVNTPASRDSRLTQEWLWTRVSSWFKEGDIIITETGTSAFGIVQSKFPNNTVGISQVLWGSIGFTVGATLGAVMAAEEIDPNKRVILFVGDGSLQLTVQEISTMVKWNTNPYLFVLNNDGYTIERLIHGENASYNDIQPWDNLGLLPLFNAKNYETVRVSTIGEAEDLFTSKAFAKNDKIRMVEVMLPRMDASRNLVLQAQYSAQANAEN
ncbi:Pyruvate decarboxylase 1 [Yamadazyma tenuis]|uniref:Pyruvate decarboxylase n=1 Tax=Candida tenuis (strain ATCC 10573 / BCRC 21748 / CBS 615 / JCM 9827 / NBRC 10315 / NRRL Y-1498 / VKM Y-70) TaxID=590646 RepID=G3B6D2_CANTC|nr:pyruvate decarboxylase [Yamadazyma tenuis ATCC 10573]EGV63437.1 pyruvate decarboxylase [Yamadazyma tenuis ATCC 10573]WEJ96735.1 Pyruvate decarboxylase 1 [Yamadazyma tenuis]